jgi:hypothetical protein
MGADSSGQTDSNEQDLGLTQFSPEVLEFMLGVVRARKRKQNESSDSEYRCNESKPKGIGMGKVCFGC